MTTRWGLIALLLVFGAVLLCSCRDDDVIVPPIEGNIIGPFPPNEDQLMANFRTAYEDMDFQALSCLMDPGYITILQQATTEQFPDVGPTLDRAEEIRIAQRMFSGSPVTDPDGEFIPAISSITFDILEQRVAWAETGPTGVIPNVRTAVYDMVVFFDRPGASVLPVEGQIRFFASRRDTVIDGVARRVFGMAGQQDLTRADKAAVARIPWGSVKALYR